MGPGEQRPAEEDARSWPGPPVTPSITETARIEAMIVSDEGVARRILDAIPTPARARPSRGTSVASESAFA